LTIFSYKNFIVSAISENLLQADSLFLADPLQMQKQVVKEEEWRKELAELIRKTEKKENEVRQLKEKSKINDLWPGEQIINCSSDVKE